MTIIEFENVSKEYPGGVKVLDGLNFCVGNGDFISLVGPTGAGKSTLLKMIYAEEFPTIGRVTVGGVATDTIKKSKLPYFRRQIGTVFQDFKLLPNRSVFQNIAFALEVEGKPTEEIMQEVPKILDIVGLTEKADKFPNQLSGGEKQKVSLARALITRPQVIVADEPTGNLDPVSSWEIVQLLLKINEYGTTIILATHNKAIVDKIKRRVIALDKGRVVGDEAQGKYVVC